MTNNIVSKYAEEIREHKPISYAGLMFYPLTMRDYDLYHSARFAFELLQSSLPPKLARLSWCACLKAIDDKAQEEGQPNPHFLDIVELVLAKALRIEPIRGMYGIKLITKNTGELSSIGVSLSYDAMPTFLNMQEMSVIRQIIAAQNGYEIPDENWNPELVRASQQNASNMIKGKLKVDLDSMINSVAANTGRDPDELWGWSILKFKKQMEAIQRKLDYIIFGIAQFNGFTKFEDGSPCPSWVFDVEKELPTGFQNVDKLHAKAQGLLGEATDMGNTPYFNLKE